MITTAVVGLLIVCAVMARTIHILYRSLANERAWANDPRTFTLLVERTCLRTIERDELEALRVECKNALKLLDDRLKIQSNAHQVVS